MYLLQPKRTMWFKDSCIKHTWQTFASIVCTSRARGGRRNCKTETCSQLLEAFFSVPVHVKGNHSTNGRLQPKCRLQTWGQLDSCISSSTGQAFSLADVYWAYSKTYKTSIDPIRDFIIACVYHHWAVKDKSKVLSGPMYCSEACR